MTTPTTPDHRLGPQEQALLQPAIDARRPPLHQLGVEAARDMVESAPPDTAPHVADTCDLSIPGPHGTIPARIYYATPDSASPAMLYFHGGGGVLGSLKSADPFARNLVAAAGITVVSVDYRLAPEHPCPVGAEEAYAATEWVHHHADQLNVDAGRLGVSGDSGGGTLAAGVALRAKDSEGPPLAFQALFYPGLDRDRSISSLRDFRDGPVITAQDVDWMQQLNFGAGPDEDEPGLPYSVPGKAESLAGAAPAIVVSAAVDPVRDWSTKYVLRLRDAGADVTHLWYAGAFHGFMAQTRYLESARRAFLEVGALIRAKVLGGDVRKDAR